MFGSPGWFRIGFEHCGIQVEAAVPHSGGTLTLFGANYGREHHHHGEKLSQRKMGSSRGLHGRHQQHVGANRRRRDGDAGEKPQCCIDHTWLL